MKKKQLNDQETIFVEQYLITAKVYESSIAAGYAETTSRTKAFMWVSDSKCPTYKRHLLGEIRKRQQVRSEEVRIDANWVLKRLALLAEFNIKTFIIINNQGLPVYDFSTATDDDWYCIQELTSDQIWQGAGDNAYEVSRVKLKLPDRLKTLELIGKHVDVQAFREKLEIEVTDKASILEAARQRANEKK